MEAIPIHIPQEITTDDDIAALILDSVDLISGDILVVAQKIVSKAEGRMIHLDEIRPGLLACGIAGEYEKDPRVVEVVLREASQIVRMKNGIIITKLSSGHVCANSGVDTSNVPLGCVLPLPVDCNASARRIAYDIWTITRVHVGVIVSDTVGRPFRNGQTDIALGCSGVLPLLNHVGKPDTHGRIMKVSVTAVADQLAGAAEIVMGKAIGAPAAILRGIDVVSETGSGNDLIRMSGDLFI